MAQSLYRSGGGNDFLQPLYADIILEIETVFAEFVELLKEVNAICRKVGNL